MNTKPGIFPGRLGIQQRVLPEYRAEFFDLLASSCEGGLGIFAGEVRSLESITTERALKVAKYEESRNYHFRDIQSPYYFLWQGGLINWLERWNPDVLIVEANPRYLSTSKGLRWMHDRGRAVIGWGLGVPPLERPESLGGRVNNWLREYLRQRLHKQIDTYLAYSHKGAREYQAISPSKKPIYVATNAVTKSPTGPPIERPPGFHGQPRVLFVGRIQARKKLDNLVRVCAALPEGLQPELWIIGDGPERQALEDLASEVYPATEFLGVQRGASLADIFKNADLFVLPGTGGLAVQEAMSYALPIIVAEGDGTQADLVKSGNGWIIAPDDEQALLNSLQAALSNPMRLREMGLNSFQVVSKEVNIEQMVKTFIEAANDARTVNPS